METGTDPTLLAMFSTLIVIMVGNIWHQSRENSKVRDLINGLRIEFDDKLNALDHKLTTRIDKLETKVEALDQKWTAKLDAMDQKWTAEFAALDQKWTGESGAMDQKWTARFDRVDGKVGLLATEVAKLSGQFLEFKLATEKHLRTTDKRVVDLEAVVERRHTELKAAIGSNGERLARIEGHLGIGVAEAVPVT